MTKNRQSSHETLLQTCAWCNRQLSAEEETYGFGARSNPNLVLRNSEGEFVTLKLSLTEKTIIALVAPEESPAKEAGYDLLFLTCSEQCAKELKDALDLERDVFSD
jgi:hypothetical protein